MCEYDAIKARTDFGFIMLFVLDVYIYEKLNIDSILVEYTKKICLLLLSLMIFLNVRFANVCYAKEEVLQSQTISYYTTLISRIESIEGYSDDLPVIYINEFKKSDNNFKGVRNFDTINMDLYGATDLINNYVWRGTMSLWCGFSPTIGNIEDVDEELIKDMPCYPKDGSIKIINGNIVVKFAD